VGREFLCSQGIASLKKSDLKFHLGGGFEDIKSLEQGGSTSFYAHFGGF